MQLVRILNSNDSRLDWVQALYEQCFPFAERRVFDEVRQLLDTGNMHLALGTIENDIVAGFVIYWPFQEFVFIEHIAIDTAQRRKGYGECMIKLVSAAFSCCILEAEHPHNTESEKRVRFYKKQGFSISSINYFQPPYHPNYSPLPMLLFTRPTLEDITVDTYLQQIRETVYTKAA